MTSLTLTSVCVVLLISLIESTDFDLTVDIPAGKRECFYHPFPPNMDAEIDYQVIDGGDMDINVMVLGPDTRVYQNDQRKTENTIKFKTYSKGDYQFCFDNQFSTFSNKIVYFEVFIEDGIDDEDEFDQNKMTFDGENIADQLDMTVQDFTGIMDRTKKNLERSVQVQTLIRIHEAKDRNTQEANFWRVNNFSVFQLGVMMCVALTQVVVIRKLFADKRPSSGTTFKAST